MISAFFTIAPIFFVILVGFTLNRYSLIDEKTIKTNNWLVFYIFLPALLIHKIANSNIKSMFDIKIIFILYASVFGVYIISAIVTTLLKINKKTASAIEVSSFRGNFAYMGLPIAYYMFSNKGIVISSMLIAFIVPFVNMLSIFAFSSRQGTDYIKVLKNSLFTPIVIASFVGIALNIFDIKIPQIIEKSLSILSLPALTLALIGIGASLHFGYISKKPVELALSGILKLFVLPFLGVLLLKIMPIETVVAKVVLIMLAAPPATLNYIMAQQLNSDYLLVSANICIGTVFSFFSYIFWIYYMKCCF